jgi:hypothetical protein
MNFIYILKIDSQKNGESVYQWTTSVDSKEIIYAIYLRTKNKKKVENDLLQSEQLPKMPKKYQNRQLGEHLIDLKHWSH